MQIMRRMVVVMLVFSAFFAIGIVALALTVAIFVKDTQVRSWGTQHRSALLQEEMMEGSKEIREQVLMPPPRRLLACQDCQKSF